MKTTRFIMTLMLALAFTIPSSRGHRQEVHEQSPPCNLAVKVGNTTFCLDNYSRHQLEQLAEDYHHKHQPLKDTLTFIGYLNPYHKILLTTYFGAIISLDGYYPEPNQSTEEADDRYDWYQISRACGGNATDSAFFIRHASMVGLLLFSNAVYQRYIQSDTSWHEQYYLQNSVPLCESVCFRGQRVPPLVGSATCFLLAPNLIATTGHCLCNNWNTSVALFGIRMTHAQDRLGDLRAQPKYMLKDSILCAHSGFGADLDIGIFRLDKSVSNFHQIKIDVRRPSTGQEIYAFGHPYGLPLKLSVDAKISSVNDSCFHAPIDLSEGNSGSPIFDRATHRLIGLHLAGSKAILITRSPMMHCYEDRLQPLGKQEKILSMHAVRAVIQSLGIPQAAFQQP